MPIYKVRYGWIIRYTDHEAPLYWLDDRSPLIVTYEEEASSRLTFPEL